MERLEYKGYKGSIKYSEDDGCFYGRIENIKDLVSYEGDDKDELEVQFKISVNDYIKTLEENE